MCTLKPFFTSSSALIVVAETGTYAVTLRRTTSFELDIRYTPVFKTEPLSLIQPIQKSFDVKSVSVILNRNIESKRCSNLNIKTMTSIYLFQTNMVRKYERMSGRQSWNEEDMARAVAAVVSGKMGYKLAARTFHIPRSTLQRRASKVRYQQPDDPKPMMGQYRRVFTESQEKDLVGYI